MKTLTISSGEARQIATTDEHVAVIGWSSEPGLIAEVRAVIGGGEYFVSAQSDLSTVIHSLQEPGLFLKRPISIVLEIRAEDEVIATFEEANIMMSGDDVRDALQGLKDEIVATYKLYKSEARLGPEPARRLKVLESFVGQEQGLGRRGEGDFAQA